MHRMDMPSPRRGLPHRCPCGEALDHAQAGPLTLQWYPAVWAMNVSITRVKTNVKTGMIHSLTWP